MKCLIVHLSDLHVKESANPIFKKEPKIVDAIRRDAIWSDYVFLTVTGDITYSGKEGEFHEAGRLLNNIIESITKVSGKEVTPIIVPGNHDLNHKTPKSKIRDIIVTEIRKTKTADDELIDQCCEPQSSFNAFKTKLEPTAQILLADKLLCIFYFPFSDYSALFITYNTAWMSQENEIPGTLHYPLQRYQGEFKPPRSDLNITLLHHTYNWFDPETSRGLRTHIESTSDFVLTGHEHIADKWKKDDLRGNYTHYIEGAVLQDHDNETNSGFNLALLDLENQEYKVLNFRWEADHYSTPTTPDEWLSYERSRSLIKRTFSLSKSFKDFLKDPGAPFRHPRKTTLTLQDLFVFPDMRDLNAADTKNRVLLRDIHTSENLLATGASPKRVVLTGQSKSGKTTLCKVLYEHYYNNGFIPIYIDGASVTTSSSSSFTKILQSAFTEQYDDTTPSHFTQLGDEVVLIIDDFDKARPNIRYKRLLMTYINKFYRNVLITANDLFPIEEVILKEPNTESVFKDYERFSLLELGNLLRAKLIEKWNKLGRDEFIDDFDLYRKTDQAKEIVDSIVGKNLIPSYPLFIVTILQSIEAASYHNLSDSSHGHYYEFLILQALIKVCDRNEKITAYSNYLSELANFMFVRKQRCVSKTEFGIFHNSFSSAYSLRIGLDAYLRDLVGSTILAERNGEICFRYKYFYYFFVAKYLANNITDPETIDKIAKMCKRIYREEFANIVIFLTHLSRHPVILEEILKNAREIFTEFSPVEFGDDISKINKLMDEMPRFVLEEKNIREYREAVLKNRDRNELVEKEYEAPEKEEEFDLKEEIPVLDLMSKLNLALKMVQILGQVLKNYYGAMKSDVKLDLAEEAYFLGLRSLNVFFSILQDNLDSLVDEVKGLIVKNKLDNRIKVEEISKEFVFYLCHLLSFAFVKRISGAVGSEELAMTLDEVRTKHDTVAVRLVDLSVRLDHFEDFPYSDIAAFKGRIVGNILPLVVLKRMVINYLYMFPVDFRERQRICDALDIPINSQRVIEQTSRQRKR
jgi:predicted phosphodiesterase